MLSNSCNKMLKTRRGFRNEAAFGEGVRDIRKVAIYETFELENTGIPEMMIERYSRHLSEDEITLCKTIIEGEVLNFTEKEKQLFGNLVFKVAQRKTALISPQCIWLCASKEDVVETYFNEDEREAAIEGIDEWIIPENACILDDVEVDGTLFAF